jgi:membrane-associated phospholipid phosphatase
MPETQTVQTHRRVLLRGALAAGALGLAGGAAAKDRSTLAGAGRSSIEAYLRLQEDTLQQSRQALALRAPSVAPRRPVNAADRVLMWNEIALDANALDYVPPPAAGGLFHQQFGPHRSSRALAVGQLAVFEAVNAKAGGFGSWAGLAAIAGDWSLDAAIAQSAHDALVHLYPPQTDRLNAILADDLSAIRGTALGVAAGRAVGSAAFAVVLARLGNDNTNLPEPSIPADYRPSGAVGEWDVDPVSKLMVALGANWPKVTPFTFANAAAFRVPPPPPVGSAAYWTAFAETRTLGGDPSMGTATTRDADQTFLGKFWSYDGTPGLCAPPRLYNQIARQLVLGAGLVGAADLARFLAIINVAMADAAIAAWESKYHYKFWRPVTAIRETAPPRGDPAFYPLGAQATNTRGPNPTPPFPAGHATFGGALFGILRSYVPDETAFTFVSDEFNGHNRDVSGQIRPRRPVRFTSLTDAETSNGASRVWLGVHWKFDCDEGIIQGRAVARHVLASFAPRLPARA